jgi:hypothetical protein
VEVVAPPTYASVTFGIMGPKASRSMDGPDNSQPMSPTRTEQVADKLRGNRWWSTDVEPGHLASAEAATTATGTTEIRTIGALRTAGGERSDSKEVTSVTQEVRNEAVMQQMGRDVDKRTPLTDQRDAAAPAASSTMDTTRGDAGRSDYGE